MDSLIDAITCLVTKRRLYNYVFKQSPVACTSRVFRKEFKKVKDIPPP